MSILEDIDGSLNKRKVNIDFRAVADGKGGFKVKADMWRLNNFLAKGLFDYSEAYRKPVHVDPH